jgi:hypothetical protein
MKNIKTYTFRKQTTEHGYNFLTVHASTFTYTCNKNMKRLKKNVPILLEFKYHARLLHYKENMLKI